MNTVAVPGTAERRGQLILFRCVMWQFGGTRVGTTQAAQGPLFLGGWHQLVGVFACLIITGSRKHPKAHERCSLSLARAHTREMRAPRNLKVFSSTSPTLSLFCQTTEIGTLSTEISQLKTDHTSEFSLEKKIPAANAVESGMMVGYA